MKKGYYEFKGAVHKMGKGTVQWITGPNRFLMTFEDGRELWTNVFSIVVEELIEKDNQMKLF